MERNLTGWYPTHLKPIRPGVYEVRIPDSADPFGTRYFSYWDGTLWRSVATTPYDASLQSLKSWSQVREWRGLLYACYGKPATD